MYIGKILAPIFSPVFIVLGHVLGEFDLRPYALEVKDINENKAALANEEYIVWVPDFTSSLTFSFDFSLRLSG